MGELLARAFTEQALLDAWADARDAALADGVAGPEVEQFEVGAARRISQLAESLADGTFTPGPLVRVDIAKPAGGLRRLEVPSLADRIVERALLAELDAVIDPLLLPWSFALPARPGCAGRAGLPGGSPRRWRGVGGTRRRQRLLRPHPALGGAAPGPRGSDRHVGRRPGAAAAEPSGNRETRRGTRPGLGLHQGTVLAPLLSNLCLDAFDRWMLAGYRVIRYSDDIAIPVPDRAAAEQALADAAEALSDLRLELDPAKSLAVSFDVGVPFLGSTVTSTTSPGAEALSHPLETVVYVDRPGSLIRSRGDRIVVEYQDQALLRLNLRRVRQVVCVGRHDHTVPAPCGSLGD